MARVTVYYANDSTDSSVPAADGPVTEGPEYVALPLVRARGGALTAMRTEIRWGVDFVRRARRRNLDLLYAHNASALPWVWLASRLRRRPFVYHAYEIGTLREWRTMSPIPVLYTLVEGVLARRAALVVCPSPIRAAWLRRHLRLREDPVVVRNVSGTPSPIDAATTTSLADRTGTSGPFLVYAGGIAWADRIEALVRSVPMWKVAGHLVLVGWGTHEGLDRVRRLADELGVGDRVHLLSAVPHGDLQALLRSGDAGLLLYGNDGNENERMAAPNKLGEYLAAGMPVVFVPSHGLDDLLFGRPFAHRVRSETPSGFAAAVDSALESSTRAEQRDAALSFVNSAYSFERERDALRLRLEPLMSNDGRTPSERD